MIDDIVEMVLKLTWVRDKENRFKCARKNIRRNKRQSNGYPDRRGKRNAWEERR